MLSSELTMIGLILLGLLGFAVGTLGTLIGAGGGFILMPILFFLYPDKTADQLTGISLAVVFLNAFSGTLAYARKKAIHYRSGVVFAIAAIPGAIIGAGFTRYIKREIFDPVFGFFMLTAAGLLVYKSLSKNSTLNTLSSDQWKDFRPNTKLGVAISVAVGFVSSLLGIGGGIIHVPAMIHWLAFPVLLATATSHFVLAITSFVGTAVHASEGTLLSNISIIIPLGIGVVIGAQLGARLSKKVSGPWIIRSLAIAIALVGIRLLLLSLPL